MRFDLITMGRVGVDLYPATSGPLASVERFNRSLGGTATNVAVAAARLGHRTAVITAVGADAFGGYVRGALSDFGVDARFVAERDDLPTPVVFAELDPPEDPAIVFYRYPIAPDMTLTAADVDLDAVRAARIFWARARGCRRSRAARQRLRRWRPGTGRTRPCSTSTSARSCGATLRRRARAMPRHCRW